jgi:predicted GH43/DUF377 family glycosyl hydrolase
VASDLAARTGHVLKPDPGRVIAKLFVPGEETPHGRSRANAVVTRILAMEESDVVRLADGIIADFQDRHHDLRGTLAANFDFIAREIPLTQQFTPERRTLIGACFTHEFSPEAAALFNPSMAPHPDQSGLAPGQLRYVMSVRCVGEGHISSIGFRTGVLGPGRTLVVDEPGRLLLPGIPRRAPYQLRLFLSSLGDLGDDSEDARLLLGGLPETFTADELAKALTSVHHHTLHRARVQRTIEHIHAVASSTYQVRFPATTTLSERLLWPTESVESNGMEDARLVRFEDDSGPPTYYATYTAYDGTNVRTHLLATQDLQEFHVSPMAGRGARNKGLALFPRRIRGRYVAVSRWDRENLAIVDSDDCRIWDAPKKLYAPASGWEVIQVGNNGSPIETRQGWLVLTHGVGPMRVYGMGALLLDRDDPSIVLASLPSPLLTPLGDERNGYVPNVVYSCGAVLHEGLLTIPYGISDGAIGFAQVELADLMAAMVENPR